MPSVISFLATIGLRRRKDFSGSASVYVVWGKQASPFPDLEHFEPIIAVVASEHECLALYEKYSDVEVSWECRKVLDAHNGHIATSQALYLTHTTLTQYDEDSEGNPHYGIVEFPRPSGIYCYRETAKAEAPDENLHLVRVGDVNLRGVGTLLP